MKNKAVFLSIPILVSLIGMMVLLQSCKKEESTNPLIIITPYSLRIAASPGDVVTYNISVTSKTKLTHFRVYIQPENDFETLYKDSVLVTKNFNWKFQYVVPEISAGKLLYLRFDAITEEGEEQFMMKQIQVNDILLTETTSLEFFTRPNLSNNAFDLEGLVQSTVSLSDSSYRDIQEFTSDTTLQSPVYYWFGPAGGKFVKANTFDYGNATFLSAKNIYESSIQKDVTDSLIVGDIYVTKLGGVDPADYVVIKLTGIIDMPGFSQDKFVFNIKK